MVGVAVPRKGRHEVVLKVRVFSDVALDSWNHPDKEANQALNADLVACAASLAIV